MSWEDNDELLPSEQSAPAPRSGGLNPNASTFSFNPGASTFAPNFAAPPPPPASTANHIPAAPVQPTHHENSDAAPSASHNAIPNGIAPMDEDEPAAVPHSTAGPSGAHRSPEHLQLARLHALIISRMTLQHRALPFGGNQRLDVPHDNTYMQQVSASCRRPSSLCS